MNNIDSFDYITSSKFVRKNKLRPYVSTVLDFPTSANHKLDMLGGAIMITQDLSFGLRKLNGRGLKPNYICLVGERWGMVNHGETCRINQVRLK